MKVPKGRIQGLAPYAKRVPVQSDGSFNLPLPAGRFPHWPVVEVEIEKAASNARAYDVSVATPANEAEARSVVKGKVVRFVQLKAGLLPTVLGTEKPITEAIGSEGLFVHVTVRSATP